MQGSELTLEGDFQPDKVYALKGSTLDQWRKSLTADRIVPGAGQTEVQTPAGRVITGTTEATGSCILGALKEGTTYPYLIPGWFIGGSISELIEPGEIEPVANKAVWLEVDWECDEEDDVLLPGGTATIVGIDTGTSGVPEDTVPDISNLDGTAYIPLGAWNADVEWTGAGCGHLYLSFCPGGFIKTRS